ncbi:nucleotide-binding protein [Anaerovibrio sp. JC8]|uniref:Mrp/NBP35 family ATP-binding protein n=1 Tax=Anaerovibrio sp. JC8 TaxID=1240085 RepID=UPI000A096D5A|nr:Mrp/NBP35 family ATP-binding protein [Anaerovibrio sp. JC8]ORT99596.1 nucleotide-binding protein [Anaerovibrio sp. JC8]
MAEECNHDCSSCGTTCGEDTRRKSFYEEPNELSKIRHAIAVVSGKGGVGKSLVTGLLSVLMSRKGRHVGIMDADITGPSVPKMFGISGEIIGNQAGAYPVSSAGGIDIVSMNLFLENTSDPVVWRGPVISGVVKQFWQDVIWNDIDYLFIDMPPGTGDVPLTVMQSIKLDGIVIVTSPQELVSMIVEKAVKMASVMKVPILGVVENMSYFECPDCGKQHKIYGESHLEEIAKEYNLDILGRIPIQPSLAAKCDAGQIETVEAEFLQDAVEKLLAAEKK